MGLERNKLFAAVAVAFGKVTPAHVGEAVQDGDDSADDLGRRLVAQGVISEHDHDTLAGMVDDAIRTHGGDASAMWIATGGLASVAAAAEDSSTSVVSTAIATPSGVMDSITLGVGASASGA